MRELLQREMWQLICDQCGEKSAPFRGARGTPTAWSEFRHSIVRVDDRIRPMKVLPPMTKDGRYARLRPGMLATAMLLGLLMGSAECKKVRTGIQRHHCPRCAQVVADMIEASRRVPTGFTEFEQLAGYRQSYRRFGGSKRRSDYADPDGPIPQVRRRPPTTYAEGWTYPGLRD